MMPILSFATLLLGAYLGEPPMAGQGKEPLACKVGPVTRTFGGAPWIVYSCTDHASMVVISAEENPASPFVFFVRPGGTGYRISGEGNGDKQASAAAYQELSKMSATAFSELLSATEAAAR